jgi:hypothetical protein
MPIAAIFFQTDRNPIPPTAFTHIPFTSEPVRSWNSESDIALFIRDGEIPLTGLFADGTCRMETTPERAADSFAEGKKAALAHDNVAPQFEMEKAFVR